MDGQRRNDDPAVLYDWRGVDRSLIRMCLALSPEQRLEHNRQAADAILELRRQSGQRDEIR